MHKKYISLGLMSGTSGDGVDASILSSDGVNKYESLLNKYFKYDEGIYNEIHLLKEKINSAKDIEKNYSGMKDLERKITIFHAKIIDELKIQDNDILVGFHGQTIYHNADEKISKQLGDAQLLHQLTKKKIIYNFRNNDIKNGGQGAPLAPIYHYLVTKQKKINQPVCFLNIGGISNITIVDDSFDKPKILSKDIGPGNCLIDNWIRKNSSKKFDKDGKLASIGRKNEIILEQAQELYENRLKKNQVSFDVNDFDISFARGLSLEDGASTLTELTSNIISSSLLDNFIKFKIKPIEILLCGGGRKNKILIKKIKEKISANIIIKPVDEYGIDGDFIESQAFAFLAIRSFKKLPLTFPDTTGCCQPVSGGDIVGN